MIILEGIDAVGKTTLAKALAQRLNTTVIHSSKPALNLGWVEYHNRNLTLKPAIYDRYHIGEAVWPIIFEDGRKPMLRWQQHMVERMLLQKSAVLILLNDSLEKINSRLKDRGEDEISQQCYKETVDLFRDSCEHSLLDYGFIHNGTWEQKDILDYAVSLYAKAQYNRINMSRFRGTGVIKTNCTMVVGERNVSGLTLLDEQYSPLCNLTDKDLHIALHLSGKTDFYLTLFKKTGNRTNDRKALVEEFYLLQPRKVVCVDVFSYNECKILLPGVNVIFAEKNLNHAEYAKFFK